MTTVTLARLSIPGPVALTNEWLELKYGDAVYTQRARERGWKVTWAPDGYFTRASALNDRVFRALKTDPAFGAAARAVAGSGRAWGLWFTLRGHHASADCDSWTLAAKIIQDAMAAHGCFGLYDDRGVRFVGGEVVPGGELASVTVALVERVGVDAR